MKYLAVLLAILSAGSAWGAELVDYVPTSVAVSAQYTSDDIQHVQDYKRYDTTDPVVETYLFSDREHDRVPMSVYNALTYSAPTSTEERFH